MRRLNLLRSRAAGFLLVALLAFAAVSIGRSLWSGGLWWRIRLEKVPEAKLDGLEAEPRKEVQAARNAANAELSQSGITRQERAVVYGRLGAVCLAYRLWDPASACFRNAAALSPDSFQWPYLL